MGSNINARIQHKRDTSSNWTTSNPVLLDGEIIIVDTDNGIRTKTGDGKKRYSQLPFDDEVVRNLISTKLSINQGTDNSGKILSIGIDGNIKTRTIRGSDGINFSISSSDDSVLISHDTSGVNPNTYGSVGDGNPAFGGTYTVPTFTVNSTGHIISAAAHILTIPSYSATTSQSGLMSSSDKSKLNGIDAGANKTVVDSNMSSTSTNPVQNKVVQSAIDGKVDKVSGRGLSTNDYTTIEKNKLAGIESGANKTTVDSAMSSTSTNPVQNKVVQTALGSKLDKSGGTITGQLTLGSTLILSSATYGTTLPSSGVAGQVFFKKV